MHGTFDRLQTGLIHAEFTPEIDSLARGHRRRQPAMAEQHRDDADVGEMAQNTRTLVGRQPGLPVDPQVRAGLTAGGRWIRTFGSPTVNERGLSAEQSQLRTFGPLSSRAISQRLRRLVGF
jgi:hypothetical protein